MDLQRTVKTYWLIGLAGMLCILPSVMASPARLGRLKPQTATETGVRERISALMNETLTARRKTSPKGTQLWLPIPPSNEALDEVKTLGDTALLILAEYLRAGSYHERELAMEFLSRVGGSGIVEPLLTVIRYDPEPSLRETALQYLSQASWEVAAPILKRAQKGDPDPRVREKAKYILESHEAQESKSPSESFVRTRIAALMGHILKKGEGVLPDGTTVWTPSTALPSNEDIKEIRHFGDDAVPILSEYLVSRDSRRKNLAIRFLGILGGNRIIEPLTMVLLNDTSAGVRELALRWLATAPWDSVSHIIKSAAETDSALQVREAANGIVASHAAKMN